MKGLQVERAKIESEIAQLKAQIGGRSTTTVDLIATGPRKRRKMSAAARERISEGMKRRYAALRAASVTAPQSTSKQTGRLTAAGRKKLSNMMKARWAAKRRAAKK